mmetsp:Transcript_15370/g.39688  ORF Transcript_15370/g.39688 Transcript_15370/m.39688 type:complete len:564 (-) Transcript_15370:64-1755(-)|eukprot:jgi/Tetstr1/455831/TSEL_042623.t1
MRLTLRSLALSRQLLMPRIAPAVPAPTRGLGSGVRFLSGAVSPVVLPRFPRASMVPPNGKMLAKAVPLAAQPLLRARGRAALGTRGALHAAASGHREVRQGGGWPDGRHRQQRPRWLSHSPLDRPMHGSRDREREGDGRPAAASLSSSADGASFNMYESGEFDPSRMTVSDHGTLHAINVAIAANFAIFIAKLGVYFASGSSAMLAEAIHSVADVCNQGLLRMGVMKSLQKPTMLHPYGYSRDRFVWSLISAVGIFCLGSGVSIVHGLNAMVHDYTLEHLGWGLTVLAVSFFVEGYSLIVAVRHVMQAATLRGMSFLQFVKRGDDPTSIAIMMEDGGAVVGLLIAGACTLAAHVTGQTFYDALGSVAVGTLLGFIAIFLIQKNRQLLIGRSMSQAQMERVMAHLKNDPVVKAIHDAKSEELGPGIFRFKAEIDFCGETLVSRHLERTGRSALHDKIRAATWTEDSKALDMVLRQYGREVVEALASEVDRIEMELRGIEPGIKHLDLEADRSPPLSKKALMGMMEPPASLGMTQFEMLKASSIDEVPIRKEGIRDWEKNNGKKP